jgi:predicted Zn-dependent protease with MMP-like domain
MKREDFVKVAGETLDSVPEEFRIRIQNVAILVEDFPANQRPPKLGQRRRLLLGIFHGVPATKRSVFNLNKVERLVSAGRSLKQNQRRRSPSQIAT